MNELKIAVEFLEACAAVISGKPLANTRVLPYAHAVRNIFDAYLQSMHYIEGTDPRPKS